MDVELLTIQELAARLKVSGRTISRLLDAGVLPVRMVGCQKRFLFQEVVDALPRPLVPDSKKLVKPIFNLVPMLKQQVKQMRRLG